MNKNQFELEKLGLEAERFHHIMDITAKVATISGWILAIYLIIEGLKSIVNANPDAINALSKVVEKLHLNYLLGWVGAVMCGGAWFYERKGKKRAYKVSSELRKQIEANDLHRSSSGLDEKGHTPK